ncbi:MAG: hypothetical protein OXG50_08195 [bacterium]|nr:hypothetical protein [bacterium]
MDSIQGRSARRVGPGLDPVGVERIQARSRRPAVALESMPVAKPIPARSARAWWAWTRSARRVGPGVDQPGVERIQARSRRPVVALDSTWWPRPISPTCRPWTRSRRPVVGVESIPMAAVGVESIPMAAVGLDSISPACRPWSRSRWTKADQPGSISRPGGRGGPGVDQPGVNAVERIQARSARRERRGAHPGPIPGAVDSGVRHHIQSGA